MFIIILTLSVLIIGLIADFSKNKIEVYNKYIIPLSVAFVLSLICLHILPELFQKHNPYIGLFILIGFVIQILLELLSKGIEHGHVHFHGKLTETKIIPIFFGISLHSFIEALPITSIQSSDHIGHEHHNINEGVSLIYFLMILVHKLPVAAILMMLFNKVFKTNIKKYTLFILFALTAPAGAIFGNYFSVNPNFNDISSIFLAISTGMLLHITTLLIFEEHHSSNEKWKNLVLISIGFIAGLISFGI
jgi:zinc transporter ZupT